jgi:hypothetical protein
MKITVDINKYHSDIYFGRFVIYSNRPSRNVLFGRKVEKYSDKFVDKFHKLVWKKFITERRFDSSRWVKLSGHRGEFVDHTVYKVYLFGLIKIAQYSI